MIVGSYTAKSITGDGFDHGMLEGLLQLFFVSKRLYCVVGQIHPIIQSGSTLYTSIYLYSYVIVFERLILYPRNVLIVFGLIRSTALTTTSMRNERRLMEVC